MLATYFICMLAILSWAIWMKVERLSGRWHAYHWSYELTDRIVRENLLLVGAFVPVINIFLVFVGFFWCVVICGSKKLNAGIETFSNWLFNRLKRE